MTFEEIRNDEQQYMMHTYGRFQTALDDFCLYTEGAQKKYC